MRRKHRPGCPCCGPPEECTVRFCVLGCNEIAVGGYSFTLDQWVDGEWVQIVTGEESRACTDGLSGTYGVFDGQLYRVSITPSAPLSDHFEPIQVEFTADCDNPIVTIQLVAIDEDACDCQACGTPAPLPTGGVSVNGVALANIGGNVWRGCSTYSVPSFKWCRTYTHGSLACFPCPDWGTYSVPVMFTLTYNCLGGAQFDILFPATPWHWEPECDNLPDEPEPADGCSGNGTNADSQCTTGGFPVWTNANRGVCYNNWRLVGDMPCIHLPCVIGPGAPAIPTCPPTFECDDPPNIEVFLVQETAEFELDCEAEDPYSVDIEYDFGPRSTTCICADGGFPFTGHDTVDHPLAAIFGTNPTFSITRT